MQTGGLSTSIDKMIQRYKEDIKILYKHFGLFFLFMFILKISNKFKGFLKLNKFNNKKLRNQLNSISQKKFKYDKF
jgi:hypothetical protein